MRSLLLPTLALLASCNQPMVSKPAGMPKAKTASITGPIVIELFQSQGCSSCPPANAALNELADEPGVIALSYAVTYWDRLGWKDSFASPAFTDRQYAYAKALDHEGVWTPQVVINGSHDIVGNGRGELARAAARTKALSGGPSISVANGKAFIAAGKGNATVWLVRYDPRTHDVPIRAGENGGRTLPHRNIVRELTKLGIWTGKAASFAPPAANNANYASVILVQKEEAGAIISAKKI